MLYRGLSELPRITRTADILVVAVGYPRLIRKEWVKRGAVVVDVGINVVGRAGGRGAAAAGSSGGGAAAAGSGGGSSGVAAGGNRSGGGSSGSTAGGAGYGEDDGQPFHVVGDVDFCDVAEVAAALTPVPGGVGPMTIAAVLHNTVKAARYNLGLEQYS